MSNVTVYTTRKRRDSFTETELIGISPFVVNDGSYHTNETCIDVGSYDGDIYKKEFKIDELFLKDKAMFDSFITKQIDQLTNDIRNIRHALDNPNKISFYFHDSAAVVGGKRWCREMREALESTRKKIRELDNHSDEQNHNYHFIDHVNRNKQEIVEKVEPDQDDKILLANYYLLRRIEKKILQNASDSTLFILFGDTPYGYGKGLLGVFSNRKLAIDWILQILLYNPCDYRMSMFSLYGDKNTKYDEFSPYKSLFYPEPTEKDWTELSDYDYDGNEFYETLARRIKNPKESINAPTKSWWRRYLTR